jgi:hypothetical protein
MSARRSSLAAAALALSPSPLAAQDAPFALEEVGFNPACGPNEAFVRLLTLMLGPRPTAEQAEAAYDPAVLDAVAGDLRHVLHFNQPAPWNGLNLAEIRLQFGVESGPANFGLAFADEPERVRAVWNAQGWDLPPPGASRVVDDEVVEVSIGIARDGALTTVTCFAD